MKNYIASLSMLLILSTTIEAATSSPIEKCEKDEYGIVELLLNPDLACNEYLSNSDLREAIRIVDQYWQWGTTRAARYNLLDKDYQAVMSKAFGVSGADEYRIPHSEQEKFWTGYTVYRIQAHDAKRIDISTSVRWEQEGNVGVTTFIFSLVRDADGWLISQVIA